MDNVEKVLEYVNDLKDEYQGKPNFISWAMIDIIDNFKKNEDEPLTTGDLEYGWFRSLEANFVRHPQSYRSCTDVNLEENEENDLAVCQELVKLFRTVAQIERGEK